MASRDELPAEVIAHYGLGSERLRLLDLRDGQHRNPTPRPEWFTTAFFHHPEELKAEVSAAGLRLEELVGIEGPSWLLPDVEVRWKDDGRRERLLAAARAVEREPSLLGLSAHLVAVARR
jgi:hypothetical protein